MNPGANVIPPPVVIDASVWVAFFVTADITHIPSYNWIDVHTQAGGLLVTPAILLTEVAAAISRRLGQVQTALSASSTIELLPLTRIVTIDTMLIKEATSIAATTRLRVMDAIYVAVAKQ